MHFESKFECLWSAVIEKWPLDSNKKGRDLGEKIRSLVGTQFSSGENSIVKNERYLKR